MEEHSGRGQGLRRDGRVTQCGWSGVSFPCAYAGWDRVGRNGGFQVLRELKER